VIFFCFIFSHRCRPPVSVFFPPQGLSKLPLPPVIFFFYTFVGVDCQFLGTKCGSISMFLPLSPPPFFGWFLSPVVIALGQAGFLSYPLSSYPFVRLLSSSRKQSLHSQLKTFPGRIPPPSFFTAGRWKNCPFSQAASRFLTEGLRFSSFFFFFFPPHQIRFE